MCPGVLWLGNNSCFRVDRPKTGRNTEVGDSFVRSGLESCRQKLCECVRFGTLNLSETKREAYWVDNNVVWFIGSCGSSSDYSGEGVAYLP